MGSVAAGLCAYQIVRVGGALAASVGAGERKLRGERATQVGRTGAEACRYVVVGVLCSNEHRL